MVTGSNSPPYPFIEPVLLTKWILDNEEIWQERKPFIESDDFAHFCDNHGIQMKHETVVCLWQLGLLRADRVVSARRIRKAGLVEIGKTPRGEYVYADSRPNKPFPAGLAAAASKLPALRASTKLLFHPFRFCVICQYQISCLSYPGPSDLTSPGGFQALEKHFSTFQARSGTATHLRPFIRANGIASLAIAAEPCMYPRIFHFRRCRTMDEATHLKHVSEHWNRIENIYKEIGEKPLKEVWGLLGWYSSSLEPNRELHEKLRLASNEVRENKLRGPLAGAVYLKTIAEVIRRAAETALQTEWPEEGETWSYTADYKLFRYGAPRIFDGDQRVSDRVLRSFWPNFGLHARWYVEGYTEWAALNYYFGPNPVGIDLVNLKGQFHGPLLDYLRNDVKNGIYSFVSLDRDVEDNCRLLQQAQKTGKFFGQWYVSKPDFEFANFSLAELQEVLWQMASEKGASPSRRDILIENTKGSQNAKQLEKGVRRMIELAGFSKGEDWGRRLMQLVKDQPFNEEGEERPIWAALRDARRAAQGWYSHYMDTTDLRVDPETGKLVRK
ncbi:MAG: hypothetical protein HY651_10670 [Acidobacteria bacterium]|nr:hypothetical protein [Acidobacteriota bacterium]